MFIPFLQLCVFHVWVAWCICACAFFSNSLNGLVVLCWTLLSGYNPLVLFYAYVWVDFVTAKWTCKRAHPSQAHLFLFVLSSPKRPLTRDANLRLGGITFQVLVFKMDWVLPFCISKIFFTRIYTFYCFRFLRISHSQNILRRFFALSMKSCLKCLLHHLNPQLPDLFIFYLVYDIWSPRAWEGTLHYLP